jgi:hypothetical protein
MKSSFAGTLLLQAQHLRKFVLQDQTAVMVHCMFISVHRGLMTTKQTPFRARPPP